MGGGNVCAVCGTNSQSDLTVKFHRLPHSESRQTWINILQLSHVAEKSLSSIRICSKHFAGSDYSLSQHGNRILKKTALPTKLQDKPTSSPSPTKTPPSQISPRRLVTTPKRYKSPRNFSLRANARSVYYNFTVDRMLLNSSVLNRYTGFKNSAVFEALFKLFLPAMKKRPLVGKSPRKCNRDPDTPGKRLGPGTKISLENQFLMTIMRLRKNIQEDVLADMYNVSQPTVSRVINTWIIVMSEVLLHLPIWPSKEHVRATLPERFSAFPTLRVIVDCTEIEIQRPHASNIQRGTFSNYKQRNTVKALVGISPIGQITFCSMLYEGSTSDKKIFNDCGILDLLTPGDSIMADRGFTTKAECESRGIQLLMPDFLSGSTQFSSDQVENSRKIANLRVLVENVIGDIKRFQILQQKIPITLAYMLNSIWFSCSYLTNFTGKVPRFGFPPENNYATPGTETDYNLGSDALAEDIGSVMLPVLLPSDLYNLFLTVSTSATQNNIETLGYLLGKCSDGTYKVTTLLLPNQSGTSVSCECEDDQAVHAYCQQNELLTLGWIHTHPQHSSFLSSVDLHTHYPFQRILKEAIAVVCSPCTGRNDVFRIKEGNGLRVIGNCNLTGFHEHEVEPEELFELAVNVSYTENVSTILVDERIN